jgi:hypothetical protein
MFTLPPRPLVLSSTSGDHQRPKPLPPHPKVTGSLPRPSMPPIPNAHRRSHPWQPRVAPAPCHHSPLPSIGAIEVPAAAPFHRHLRPAGVGHAGLPRRVSEGVGGLGRRDNRPQHPPEGVHRLLLVAGADRVRLRPGEPPAPRLRLR